MSSIREKSEELEHMMLCTNATFSDQSVGRETQEEPCPIRTCFQRDRDRIVHCKSYRRLMHKTQVFLSPEGDHYRTRLTHTLEVSQIARTISCALRLNETLTEAIAQGHDLGHSPFGHAGEKALDEICPQGFRHNEQSVRVVRYLEKEGKGLNLTGEVIDGILCHSAGSAGEAKTREGRVVRFADKIAYMNHDIDDAIRAGVLDEEDVPWEIKYTLGRTKSQRITTLVESIIQNSGDDIQMDKTIRAAYDQLMDFMFEAVYKNPVAKGEEGKARDIVKRLYAHFISHTERLPEEYINIIDKDGPDRAVCDYISGMSDRYCVSVYTDLFIPKSWTIV